MNRLSRGSQKFHKRNRLCWYCGARVVLDPKGGAARMATVDHQTPISRGGSGAKDNLVTACQTCNQQKANMTVEEYRAYLAERRGAGVVFHGEKEQ